MTDGGLPLCNLRTLEGHKEPVLNFCYSANGRYILSCSQDRTIKLWNPAKDAGPIKSYTGAHNYEINDICVTPDSRRFFTVGGDKNAYAWDVETGDILRKFIGHDRKITACCLLDDSLFFTASHDRTVRAWDLRQRQRDAAQVMHDATDSCIKVRVLDKEIIVGSVDGCMYCYDVRKGCMTRDYIGAPIGSIAISNDDQCVLISTLDHSIGLYEKSNGEELTKYKGHKNENYKLESTFSPADDYVCSGSEDGLLFFWDLVSAEVLRTIHAHKGAIFAARFSPKEENPILCTSGADNCVRVWSQGAT